MMDRMPHPLGVLVKTKEIRVHPCPSVFKLLKAFILKGCLAGWTATVSKSVNHGADGKTIHHNCSRLAEAEWKLFLELICLSVGAT